MVLRCFVPRPPTDVLRLSLLGISVSTLFGGSGIDRLIGSAGNDKLYGGTGNDTLNGGNGNDFLRGDQGNDYLLGGNGWDSFIFRAGNDADTVADFTLGQDRLMMTDGLTGGITDTAQIVTDFASVSGGNMVFDFGGGNTITLEHFTDIGAISGSILMIA